MEIIEYEVPALVVYEEDDLRNFEAAAGTNVSGNYNTTGSNNCFLQNIKICITKA